MNGILFKNGLFVALSIMLACSALQGRARDQPVIDSLVSMLNQAKEDTNKTRLFYRIWQQYRNNDIEQAAAYARKGLDHALKMKWDKGIAAFYTSIGEDFDNRRQTDSALYYYSKAIAIYQKTGFAKGLAGAYNNMSVLYDNKSDYVKALEYSFKALNIVQAIKDTSYTVLIFNNIGKYYFNQENYPKAKEYTLKALSLAEDAGLEEGIGNAYSQLGMIFSGEKDTAQSIRYYNRAIRIFEASRSLINLAGTYSNLSVIKKDYREQFEYALKAKNLFDSLQLTNHNTSIANLGNIGMIYFDLVRFKDRIRLARGDLIPRSDHEILTLAEQYLSRAVELSRASGGTDNLYHFLKVLGELEEYRGYPEKALACYKESYALSDSLFSQENKNKIASLESQRAIDRRDKQLAINKLELRNERRTKTALIAGAVLLLIIGGLLFYQNRIRRKTNAALLSLNKGLDEANQVKARFFGILSHDLRSPIANLVHYLHLQKEAPDLLDKVDPELRHRQLAHSAENLLETMESVLLWSKSQMERFVPQKRKIAVSDLFEYIRKNTNTAPAINIACSDPDHIFVHSDPDYLKTIMLNLTTNAIKALKDTPNAQISWKAIRGKGHVAISITDNGPGVSPAQAEALFDKAASVKTKEGLGLHIIRDLAAAIGCKVVLDTPGLGGTCFKLIVT